jgi:hypothetical protein
LIKPVARGRRARVNIITNLNICRSWGIWEGWGFLCVHKTHCGGKSSK